MFWYIGSITGEYQPEDFTETQEMKVEDQDAAGSVSTLVFKGWSPREVTISFVVDGIKPDATKTQTLTLERSSPSAPIVFNKVDPEDVWRMIQILQRTGESIRPIGVMIPGWGGENQPKMAVITKASIQRTHIKGEYPRAVRATISVTLKEWFETEEVIAEGTE